MKGHVLHRARAHLKVPGCSLVLNALLTKKLPMGKLPMGSYEYTYSFLVRRRLGDRFREHLRDVEKDDKDASKPVTRHFILSNIWRSVASPYIKEAQEAAKLLSKDLFFKSALLILTVSTNAFHSTNSLLFFTLPGTNQ